MHPIEGVYKLYRKIRLLTATIFTEGKGEREREREKGEPLKPKKPCRGACVNFFLVQNTENIFNVPNVNVLSSATVDLLKATELFKKQLKAIGLDPNQYGPHRLRSGEVSSAVAAVNPDRLLVRHGDWRSQTANNMYIK